MAVTFAVGAVTGTVLSLEMGLLWPGLMGRYGGAFGIPFAVEGLFFFLEAIFIAIYIYGWRRLWPGLHLLSGVPVALAGIGGTVSVVAAKSWMNLPWSHTFVAPPAGRRRFPPWWEVQLDGHPRARSVSHWPYNALDGLAQHPG